MPPRPPTTAPPVAPMPTARPPIISGLRFARGLRRRSHTPFPTAPFPPSPSSIGCFAQFIGAAAFIKTSWIHPGRSCDGEQPVAVLWSTCRAAPSIDEDIIWRASLTFPRQQHGIDRFMGTQRHVNLGSSLCFCRHRQRRRSTPAFLAASP